MSQPVLELLGAVARQIEDDWQRADNEVDAFTDIVERHTRQLEVTALGELTTQLELLRDPYVAMLQQPSDFSDAHLKLWDNGRFMIELLNWWGSDINVHDHDVVGMQFQVRGRSLNVVHHFEEALPAPRLASGKLSVVKAEIWNPGDRSFVRHGPAEPHTVYHLDVPTVSMLIHTHAGKNSGAQRNYFAPLAASYEVADLVFRKRVRMLRLLSRGDAALFRDAVERVIAQQTQTETFFLFLKLSDVLFQRPHVGVVEAYAARGGMAETIVRAAAGHRASDFITNVVKQTPGLPFAEVLAASVLGSCHDAESLEVVLGQLAVAGHEVDVAGLMASVQARLTRSDDQLFRRCLDLLGAHDVIGRYAKRACQPLRQAI